MLGECLSSAGHSGPGHSCAVGSLEKGLVMGKRWNDEQFHHTHPTVLLSICISCGCGKICSGDGFWGDLGKAGEMGHTSLARDHMGILGCL